MKSIGIIPARFESSRFPGKALVDIKGKSMIQRVYEQASRSKLLEKIIVATDDDRIYQHVLSFGGEAVMTDITHQSGTDRCAEVIENYPNAEIIINIQGDEPFIQSEQIDNLVSYLDSSSHLALATLAKKINDSTTLFDPNIVKVIFDNSNKALYFSRQAIPFIRGKEKEKWLDQTSFYKHIGLYAYRRKTLQEISQLARSKYEILESLEQLRWLENGYAIGVLETKLETIGIDTPDDLKNILSKL